MGKRLIGLMLAVVCATAGFATAQREAAATTPAGDAYDAWLKTAQLGPYQPGVEDWDAIYQAALKEPSLLVYAGTSRIFNSIKDLNAVHPGLKIEAVNLESPELLERMVREWDAGLRKVGVLFSALPNTHHELLLPRRAVTRYVPRELEAVMPASETQPLLRHRHSAYVWIYNNKNFDAPPWKNVWELTTEKFRNRVVIGDLSEGIGTITYYVAVVTHAKEMAAMYQQFFGEPIKLTTPNAGFEFIKRIFDNDVRIVTVGRDVADAVTNSTGPFAGLTGYSRYREALDGVYRFDVDRNVAPAASSFWYLSIGSFTPSPNTAKILVNWLMSQKGGKYWWGPNFPSNPLVKELEKPFTFTLADFPTLWAPTPEDFARYEKDIIDYWLLWR